MNLEESLKEIEAVRDLMNQGKVLEANNKITEDFFAVFSLHGEPSSYEMYDAEGYREGNQDATKRYEGKHPHWQYQDFGSAMKSDHEIILSSRVEFSLDQQPVMNGYCLEIYRKEQDEWKLARQYMEKFKGGGTPSFQSVHDGYLKEWEHAMASQDSSTLEDMLAEDYHVTFLMRNQEKPVFFNREQAVQGMKQSIASANHAEKRFENRVIRMKGHDQAAVFYEQTIVKGEEELARLFTIENWRNRNGTWEIISEVQEHVN